MPEPIRYYFDQHYPHPVADGLRRRGIDVLTAQDAGRCGLPDTDQLAFAAAEERVMATFDPDYLALHQSGIAHAGIAWCRADWRIDPTALPTMGHNGSRYHEESGGISLTQTLGDAVNLYEDPNA